MGSNKRIACTTVLVGKKASIDGSIMIARNEDFHKAISPKIFVVKHSVNEKDRIYKSLGTGVNILFPEKAYRYTSVLQAILMIKRIMVFTARRELTKKCSCKFYRKHLRKFPSSCSRPSCKNWYCGRCY